MYILTQNDLDIFNNIKKVYQKELDNNFIDVVPISNGATNGMSFTPDGTYSLDYYFFAPPAQNFLAALISQHFFDNLETI